MSRDNKLTTKVDDIEKGKVEKLADACDCSQSALIRQYIETHYEEVFGDIHPDALDRHDIEMGELLRGDVSPGDIDDDYKLETEGAASVPAADGGVAAAVSPASHTPTPTPQDLATAGPALSWDELTEATDKHWSDGLEIHPDRVDPQTLKNNHGMCSKIIAGVLRSEQDIIVENLIDDRIEEYLGHKVERADYEAGLEYRIDQYKPQIIEHLESHPGTRIDTYYASPSAIERDLPRFVTNTLEDLQENSHVLDIETWADEKEIATHQLGVKEIELWLEQLREFRHNLYELRRVRKDPTFIQTLIDSDVDYPEDSYKDPIKWIRAVCESWTEQYGAIDPLARYAAVNTIGDTDPELLDSEIDTPSGVASKYDDAPDGKVLATITKRVSLE